MSDAYVLGPRGPLLMQCATAIRASDGDTLDVTLENGMHGRIRLCGVNAWEMVDYGDGPQARGDGLVATSEIRRVLTASPHVHLSSRYPESETGGRLKRYVDVRLPEADEWIDLGLHLVRLGLVRLLAQAEEYDRNLQYAQAQRAAMAARVGMWATLGTGVGASLRLGVDWSGAESVTLTNTTRVGVDLTGHWLCDGMTRTKPGSLTPGRGYEFAPGTKLGPGLTLTLRVGPNGWDVGSPYIFDNPTGAPSWISDGVYLGDPSGAIVGAHVYPDLTNAPQE